MTIKINEADLLDLLGENGERWIQGDWGNDQQMCLHGAIRRCSPHPGDAFIIEKVAERQGWGTAWNDSSDTNWSMIRQRLAHVEVTDADLAATFGPNWEHVVALVRRAAILTDDEARQLHSARDAAWLAARNVAQVAAWDAARDTARFAAWDAAQHAARNAAWDAAQHAARIAARDAAWLAAWALAVRDLIGQHGFTQAHYNLLTGPWRSAIGPVHPDDEEARRG